MFGASSMSVLTATSASSGWDLRTFLENAFDTLVEWFALVAMILGIVAIIIATYQIFSGLASQGKKQVNWALSIVLLLFGGILSTTGGFQFMQDVAGGGRKTIEDLGGQTITILYMIKPFLP